MKFRIDSKIFEKFPELNIGVVLAKGVSNKKVIGEIQNLIRDQEKRVREQFSLESLSQHPKITVWQEAYRAFGAKPKDYKSSVENLYRLVLEGVDLRQINNLVDIYNSISLKYMLPVGGEDLDKIRGDIVLTLAGSSESPVLLLGDKEPRPPHQGEVIYKDEISAICRRWNWREADRTKLTGETKNCILVIEGLPPVAKEEIKSAAEELVGLVQKFCGGEIISRVLNRNDPEVEI